MNADGSNPVNLTNNIAYDAEPAWSPDGTKIAFTSLRSGNYETYVMNADGSGLVNLTNNPATERFLPGRRTAPRSPSRACATAMTRSTP